MSCCEYRFWKLEWFHNYYFSTLGEWFYEKPHETIKLTPTLSRDDVLYYSMYDDCWRKKSIAIHRIIATIRVKNPMNYKYVHFIDWDKTNRCPCNLMWIYHHTDHTWEKKERRSIAFLEKRWYKITKTDN